MANTYTLIQAQTLASAAATVTFSSIPATYTDLVLQLSARSTYSGVGNQNLQIEFNGSAASNYSMTWLLGTGSAASSARQAATTEGWVGDIDTATSTANTFGSLEIYIPNYASSNKKPFSSFSVQETNATVANIKTQALLWGLTNAITSIRFKPDGGNLDVGSSFYLYGIKNS